MRKIDVGGQMNWNEIYTKLMLAKKFIDDVPNMPIASFESALLDALINLQKAIEIAERKKE